MNLHITKARNFFGWLFWFYVEYGNELSRRTATIFGIGICLLLYLSYESLFGELVTLPWTNSERWVPMTMAVLFLPPATLVLYGYFFGARHRLEKLDPAYTTPSPLAPFAFAAVMIFIALSKYLEWW
jgi:hypothetical protein